MAANLYKNQSLNVWKTWLLMSIFFVMIMIIGLFVSYYYNDAFILYFALGISILMNIISYWYSDKIVLALAGAKKASREEYYDLFTLTENLAITAGLPMPKIYVISDEVPNAFATGRDKEHAVVAVTDGLLRILDKNELEGVIAHELAHIGNRDILLQTVVVILVGLVTMIADIFFRMQFHSDRDRGKGGGVILVLGLVLMVLSPIFATLLQLAISRKREFLADASGAMLTRYPEGLASALEKISSASVRPLKKANHATAHLFIYSPFGGGKGGKVNFFEKMFSTHPPVEERVAALRGLEVK